MGTDKMNRRDILKLGGAGIVGLAVGVAAGRLTNQTDHMPIATIKPTASVRQPPTKERITIATASDQSGFTSVARILTAGKLNDMGYDTELALLGVRGSLDAFLAGNVQFLIHSPSVVMPAIEQGEDILMVGPDTSLGYVLVSSTDLKDIKDLEGKTVGITKPGGLDDTVIRFLMKRANVDVGKVNWVALGGGAARSAALLSGKIDAAMQTADNALTTISGSEGKLSVSVRLSDIATGLVPDLQIAHVYRKWASENGQVIEDFVRARIMSEVWALNNKQEFLTLAASKIYEKTDTESMELCEQLYNFYRGNGWLPFLSLDLESINLQLDLAKEAGAINGTVPAEKVYDSTYVNTVIQGLLKYEPTL